MNPGSDLSWLQVEKHCFLLFIYQVPYSTHQNGSGSTYHFAINSSRTQVIIVKRVDFRCLLLTNTCTLLSIVRFKVQTDSRFLKRYFVLKEHYLLKIASFPSMHLWQLKMVKSVVLFSLVVVCIWYFIR